MAHALGYDLAHNGLSLAEIFGIFDTRISMPGTHIWLEGSTDNFEKGKNHYYIDKFQNDLD